MALAVCLRMLWSESVDSGQGGDLAHTLGQMRSGDQEIRWLQVTPGDTGEMGKWNVSTQSFIMDKVATANPNRSANV